MRWSGFALPALAVGVLAWGAAWFLWTSRERGERERRAAALLAVSGAVLVADPGLLLLGARGSSAYAAAFVGATLLVALPVLQLWLIATFPGRGTLPLRVPLLAYSLLVLTMLGMTLSVLRPSWAVLGVQRAVALDAWVAFPGLIAKLALAAWLVTLAYGAFVSATAMTRAASKDEPALRSWMTAYVSLAIGAALHVFLRLWSAGGTGVAGSGAVAGAAHVLAALPLALFVLFTLQATARERPAGAGRRARRFVSTTTVVAIFTFPIVLAGELLEGLIGVPNVVAGILVAVMLAALLRPIQRVADRLARRIVQESEVAPGAAELYRSAIQGAFGDGEINAKEHRTLERLGRQLGLSADEAARIEAETLGQLRG